MRSAPLRRRLGPTDLSVHPLCLGGNVFGWSADRDASFAVLDAYRAAGGNFVDTADVYSAWVPGHAGGESEAILGAWLRERGCRDEIVVATKVGLAPPSFAPSLAPERIRAGCDASLARLGVDRIDLYYAHRDDPATPLDETLGAFDALVRAGKVRWIGASNYSAPRLSEALATSARLGLAPFTVVQPEYNLVDRAALDGPLAALSAERGLGVCTYYALASGFLTGKYRPGEPPTGTRAGHVARHLGDPRAIAILAAVEQVARAHGATAAEVAIAWQLHVRAVTTPIASATSVAQLEPLLRAVELRLGPDDLALLDACSGPAPARST
jgi:aryl-alcohol dehydrogenase (NADP+)